METITALSIFFALVFACFLVAAIYIYSKLRNNLENSDSSSPNKFTTAKGFWKAVKGEVTESRLDYKDTKGLLNRSKRLYRARFTYQYYAYDKMYTHSQPASAQRYRQPE